MATRLFNLVPSFSSHTVYVSSFNHKRITYLFRHFTPSYGNIFRSRLRSHLFAVSNLERRRLRFELLCPSKCPLNGLRITTLPFDVTRKRFAAARLVFILYLHSVTTARDAAFGALGAVTPVACVVCEMLLFCEICVDTVRSLKEYGISRHGTKQSLKRNLRPIPSVHT